MTEQSPNQFSPVRTDAGPDQSARNAETARASRASSQKDSLLRELANLLAEKSRSVDYQRGIRSAVRIVHEASDNSCFSLPHQLMQAGLIDAESDETRDYREALRDAWQAAREVIAGFGGKARRKMSSLRVPA